MSEKPKAKPVKGTTRLKTDLDAIVEAAGEGDWRSNVATALAHLLAEATIYYYELGHAHEFDSDPSEDDDVGESLTADRDLLEIKLIAKYAPPFNIKAER